MAEPIAAPIMTDSEIGVSLTLFSPKWSKKPRVTAYVPPHTPTSSTKMNTRSSRSISSQSACEMASRIVMIGMWSAHLFDVDVAEQDFGRGVGALFGEPDRLLDFARGLIRRLLQFGLGRVLVLDQILVENANGIVLLPLGDFFVGAIALGISHRMPSITISHGLEQEGAIGSHMLEGRLRRLPYLNDVHPIHPSVGHPVSVGLLADLRHGRGALDGSAHAVLVVLTNPQDRELPDHGQVHGFVKITDVRRTVSEQADCGGRGLVVFVGQSQPGCQREVGPDDGVPAPEVEADIGHVHRAAFPFRAARGFAEKLGEAGLGLHPRGDGDAVIPIGRDHAILWATSRDYTTSYGFLADI